MFRIKYIKESFPELVGLIYGTCQYSPFNCDDSHIKTSGDKDTAILIWSLEGGDDMFYRSGAIYVFQKERLALLKGNAFIHFIHIFNFQLNHPHSKLP